MTTGDEPAMLGQPGPETLSLISYHTSGPRETSSTVNSFRHPGLTHIDVVGATCEPPVEWRWSLPLSRATENDLHIVLKQATPPGLPRWLAGFCTIHITDSSDFGCSAKT